jgi:hypothetical protein
MGVVLALFGTIIPPLLMNAGFPLTGIGLGSIVSALELPVSVTDGFCLIKRRRKTVSMVWNRPIMLL